MKTDSVDLTVGANRGLGKLSAASLVARFVADGYAAAREAWAPICWYFSWPEIVVLMPLAIGATVTSSAREAFKVTLGRAVLPRGAPQGLGARQPSESEVRP